MFSRSCLLDVIWRFYFFGIWYLKTIFYLPRVTAQTFRVFLQLFLDERVPVEMLNKRPGKGFDRPVDDFEKGDEAEAKTEPKEAAQ